MNCAGVDWASEKHDVLVADEAGERLLAATFAHDEAGLRRAVPARWCGSRSSWSRSSARTGCWSSGCSTPGCGCWRCIPTRSRRRGRGSGPRAASPIASTRSCCASSRAPISHRFRVLVPDSDQTKALRALTRAREDLVARRGRAGQPAARRARALLARAAPASSPTLDSPIALAFLERYPSPRGRARRSASSAWRAFLARQHYCGAQQPASCWPGCAARPRAAPATLETDARRAGRARAVATLEPLVAQIAELDQRDRDAVRAHPDGADLPLAVPRPQERDHRRRRCWPRSATAATATPPRRARRRRRPSRRRRSSPANASRRASAGPATNACATRSARWPTAPATGTPGPPTSTPHARARGHDHPRAIRTLGRAWCRVLWRCWQDHTPYDPARHRGLQQHITVTIPGRRAPGPTSPPPSGWLGAAVTHTGGPQGRARSA